MQITQSIRKIRIYARISFLLPLIAISTCLFIYIFLGNIETYKNYDWEQEAVEEDLISILTPKNNNAFTNLEDQHSSQYTKCPKYIIDVDYELDNKKIVSKNDFPSDPEGYEVFIAKANKENRVKTAFYKPTNKLNYGCLKNYPTTHWILKKITWLEKTLLTTKQENKSGFSKVKNPYFYGEISISRSARYFPGTLIFKALLIISSITLFLYWKNTSVVISEMNKKKIINKPSKKFFYLGSLSCLFLFLHAVFFSVEFEINYFDKLRKLILFLFIIFEVLAQYSLTMSLIKTRNQISLYLNNFILNIKLLFIILILAGTIITFIFLISTDTTKAIKNVIEWNYFSILMFYYFLSSFVWKNVKTEVHTPKGV